MEKNNSEQNLKDFYTTLSDEDLMKCQMESLKKAIAAIYVKAAKSQGLTFVESQKFFDNNKERLNKDMRKFVPVMAVIFSEVSLDVISASR